jgi:hypothetical protein
MFYEYALDPAVLKDYPTVRYYVDLSGWYTGRFISQYPSDWRKRVYKGLRCGDIEKAKITFKLQKIKGKMIPRPGAPYDDKSPWLENAIKEHSRVGLPPFRLIIADQNSNSHNDVTMASDLDEDTEERWRTSDPPTERDAAAYAAILDLPLKCANEVIFVDPYFNVSDPGFLNVFVELLKKIFCNSRRQAVPNVGVHVKNRWIGKMPISDHLRKNLWKYIPPGHVVRVWVWDEVADSGEKLHNRYILTNRGGVSFGIGLQENDSEGGGGSDDLARLREDQYRKRWQDYMGDPAAFKLVVQFEVTGGVSPSHKGL